MAHWEIMNGSGHFACYASCKRAAMNFAKRIDNAAMILYRGPRPEYPTRDVRLVHHYVWKDGRVDAARDGDRYVDHPNAAGR